jgi:hypothetical protein
LSRLSIDRKSIDRGENLSIDFRESINKMQYFVNAMSISQQKNPIRKIHYVGSSAVLTIDQSHIRRLGIDEFTFFEEKPIENGIQLEVRKLIDPGKEEENT